MSENLIFLTDSYKVSQFRQYPPGTEGIYSYLESRGGKFKETVFFGLQYYLETYLAPPSGRAVSLPDVFEAQDLFKRHFGKDIFNYDGWSHICRDHQGHLPLRIRAVDEGAVIPTHNPLLTVENTCPQCAWVTDWFETLLVMLWYPITVATMSREIKKTILKWLELNGDPSLIDYKLHDFGFRGASSPESAGIGGCAHLVNFKGTDTLRALQVARRVYGDPCAGLSIPASQHSTITSWGRGQEAAAYRNMISVYPDGLVACVSDSYDIHAACDRIWGQELKDQVMARQGTLVIRPDSGYPPQIVCDVLGILGERFGYSVNAKGYKVLDPHVSVIQGDGIDADMIEDILLAVDKLGWSADNVAFGMGGALLQKVDRDINKFALKCSSAVVDGVERDVFKEPATDLGKRSKPGRLALVSNGDGSCTTVRQNTVRDGENMLRTVFVDGQVRIRHKFHEIRERAAIAPAGQLKAAA